jgi:hypothetical protein
LLAIKDHKVVKVLQAQLDQQVLLVLLVQLELEPQVPLAQLVSLEPLDQQEQLDLQA